MAAATHTRLAADTHASERLARLPIHELASLYDAFTKAAESFLNEMNSPRCRGAVAILVEDEWERCNLLSEKVAEELRRRKPVDDYETMTRLRVLVTRSVVALDGPLDLIDFVHSLQAVEMH